MNAGEDISLKILMIGDSGVGKSSLLLRFTDNYYDADQPSTIGVDYKVRLCVIDGQNVKLNVWDDRNIVVVYSAEGIILSKRFVG